MLAKKNRLTKAQFDRFFSSGKRIHSPLLQLIYTPHQQFHGAVVVGKKVSKKAVRRNQLRRRVYGHLYRWHTQTETTGVYIVILKPAANQATRKEVVGALENVLTKLP